MAIALTAHRRGPEPGSGWLVVETPKRKQKLADEMDHVIHLPEIMAKIEALGLQVGGGKPEEFQKVVRADSAACTRIPKSCRTRGVHSVFPGAAAAFLHTRGASRIQGSLRKGARAGGSIQQWG